MKAKPCHRCGSKLQSTFVYKLDLVFYQARIDCLDCRLQGGSAESDNLKIAVAAATTKWNLL